MLKDYILFLEFLKKTNTSWATFYSQINREGNERYFWRIGMNVFARKDFKYEVSEKYWDAFDSCTDLSNLIPTVYFAERCDISADYFTQYRFLNKKKEIVLEDGKRILPFEHGSVIKNIVTIHSAYFVEVEERFLKLMTVMGYVPFRIRTKEDEEYAEPGKIFKISENITVGMY